MRDFEARTHKCRVIEWGLPHSAPHVAWHVQNFIEGTL